MEWSHVTWRDGQHVSVAWSTDETRGGTTYHTHNAPADHTAICTTCQGTQHRLILVVIPKLAILTLSLLNISNTISLNYFAFPFSNINFSHLFTQIKTEGEADMTAPRPTLISEMLAPPQPPPQSQPPPAQPPQSVTSTSAPMSGKVQS